MADKDWLLSAISPWYLRLMPLIQLSSDVLPEPLGPMMAVILSLGIEIDSCFSTCLVPKARDNAFVLNNTDTRITQAGNSSHPALGEGLA
jgi:hypothetical protein